MSEAPNPFLCTPRDEKQSTSELHLYIQTLNNPLPPPQQIPQPLGPQTRPLLPAGPRLLPGDAGHLLRGGQTDPSYCRGRR